MICRILAHPVKETNQTAKRLLSLDDRHFVKRLTQRTPRLSGLLPVSRSGSQHWSTDRSARRRRRQRPYPNARIKGNCRSMNHTCQRTKVLSVTIVAIEAGIFANANHPTKSRSLCPQRWSCRREGQGDRPIGRSFQPNTLTSPFIKSLWTLRASSTVFCSTPQKGLALASNRRAWTETYALAFRPTLVIKLSSSGSFTRTAASLGCRHARSRSPRSGNRGRSRLTSSR